MGKEESAGIQHCQQLLKALEALEEIFTQFDTLEIDFVTEAQRKINYRSALTAFILPMLVLSFYLTNDFAFVDNEAERSILQTFLGTFIVSFSLWALGIYLNSFFKKLFGSDSLPIGQKSLAKQLFPKYSRKREKMITDMEMLLDCEALKNTPIPEKYLNLKSLNYITETLRLEEASTLKEAVELLDLEIKNSRVQCTLTEKASTLRAEEIINGGISQTLFEQWLKERI